MARGAWRIKRLFGETWSRLASDFLDELGGSEYNSIKHGLRARASGMTFPMGRTDDPDAPPIIDSASDFGSRFFAVERLHEDPINFYVRYAGRTWCPRALAVRTELICLSLGNIVSFLRSKIGVPVETVPFHWPEIGSNVDLAWASPGTIDSFVGGDELEIEEPDLCKKEQILSSYRAGPDL